MSNKPTKILEDGTQIWLNSEDILHRDNDLPARIWPDGQYDYYQNGQRHRDNGLPALICADGYCQWWIDNQVIEGRDCTQEEIEQFKLPYGGK